MRIVQLVPTLHLGDAIGNDVVALDGLLKEMGCETGIYADLIAPAYKGKIAWDAASLPALQKEDVVLYHHGTGSPLCDVLAGLPSHKVMIYHNVTPPVFFGENDLNHWYGCAWGERCTLQLRDVVEYCIADSQFNKDELLRVGYTCPIDVCPVLIPFADYQKEPDRELMARLDDGRKNILFIGRIAANKKQEDVLRAFALYQKYYDAQARLFIVGSRASLSYAEALEAYARELGVERDVYFTGSVPFADILAYYRAADLFLCMSEHEGFCVPLLEAMCFDVPILAYASSAVTGTMGGAGVLVTEKDYPTICALMDRMLHDEALRAELIAGQRKRLADFSYEKVSARMKDILRRLTVRMEGCEERNEADANG